MATVNEAIKLKIGGVDHVLYRGRLMKAVQGGETVTVEQLEERQTEIAERLRAIDSEHEDGRDMSEEARSEWNTLNEEHDSNKEQIGRMKAEQETRRSRIEELSSHEGSREDGAHFHTPSPGAARGDDIYDLSTVRMSLTDPEQHLDELRDRALRSVEQATFPERVGDPDDARARIERLIARCDRMEGEDVVQGEISRRILVTGSPVYQRAFRKYLGSKPYTNEEARALSIGTGSAGGFAVVYTLDPTIIPTSNLSVNPYRGISRVETIAGTNEWRGITSAGVTASRAAEGSEVGDNAPTLAQPSAIVTKVHTFVPFTLEVGQDWPSLQSEMATLIQDAKDDEEATAFSTGAGTGVNPQGIITGATTTVTLGGTAAFAAADLYKIEEALGPRFRPRAQWVGNRFTYNKVRQFDTAGGAQLWMQLQRGLANTPVGNMNAELIGYPANEASPLASALTTGSKILVLGDWRYFLIVDRVGLDVEVVPHLFGSNGRPIGSRGIYCYWRNTSRVLDANGFRVAVTG